MCWHLMPRDTWASSLVFESIASHQLDLWLSGGSKLSEQAPGPLHMQFDVLTVSRICWIVTAHAVMMREYIYSLEVHHGNLQFTSVF